MNSAAKLRQNLATRLRAVRIDLFGEGEAGVVSLAAVLGLPPETWLNYESGVTLPAEVVLKLITLAGVDSRWLLTGKGPRYSGPDPRTQPLRKARTELLHD